MKKMKSKHSLSAEIIVADSETDANLYYATRFIVPDPVLFFQIRGKRYLMLNDLEVDRGRREAEVDEVVSLSEWEEKVKKKIGQKPTSIDMMVEFLKEKKVRNAIVPYNFPGFIASELQKRKIILSYRHNPFWKNRLLKTKEEKKAIELSLKHTGNAIRKAYEVLKASVVRKGSLFYQDEPLTSECLRRVIDLYLMENQCLARNTIVAGGNQAVDPHNRGSGPLKADQAIVMDVFPRSMKTQYYADMTRTVVKGKPSPELKKIWRTVKEAQERAIEMIKEGINGKKVHLWILDFFESKGYKTGKMNGRMQGFFHGTGHGLGLDIHEAPRISKFPERLKKGMVVTVEPGLYYQGIGGVRIEDVVYVTKDGCEVLSHCPKILAIP
jgi:Xaa-Pro aminopeptidase